MYVMPREVEDAPPGRRQSRSAGEVRRPRLPIAVVAISVGLDGEALVRVGEINTCHEAGRVEYLVLRHGLRETAVPNDPGEPPLEGGLGGQVDRRSRFDEQSQSSRSSNSSPARSMQQLVEVA